jgi:peroxiredoxin
VNTIRLQPLRAFNRRNFLAGFVVSPIIPTLYSRSIPSLAPALQIQRVGQASLSLSQYRGKLIVMAFISIECVHCQQLTTLLINMARDYSSERVQLLECAFSPDAPQRLPGFIKQFQPSFPVGYCSPAAFLTFLQCLSKRSLFLPHLVFINRRGRITSDYSGETAFVRDNTADNIRTELRMLLHN